MPKYTFYKLTKGKSPKDLASDDDAVIIPCGEFSQCRKPNPKTARVDFETEKSISLGNILFSDHEDAPSSDLSNAFGSVDMLEKGADIQVANLYPKAMPIPMPQTSGPQDIEDTAVIITAQVNDYPTFFLRSDPTTNTEILDIDAYELDMVWFFPTNDLWSTFPDRIS